MDARTIIVIIMGVLLLGWVLGVAVALFRRLKKIQIQSGMIGHVKCEKCGTEYDVTAEDFYSTYFSKKVTVTKTKVKGVALDNSPNYVYYAKKFNCPCCGKKRYAQVLNHPELIAQNRPVVLKEGIKYLAIMMAGGMVIMALTSIPMSIAQKLEEKRVEQMKEERYEELQEQYDIED